MDELPANPHDALFRAAFGEPTRAGELLRASLPPALAAGIDWTSLRRLPESFVDDALRDRRADLVFVATADDGDALLYVLFGHKSAPDRWLPLQLLRYRLRLWDAWRRAHPACEHLPPILPFVLYHGERWSGPRSIAELVDARTSEALRQLQPSDRFVLQDLGAYAEPDWGRLRDAAGTLLTLLHLRFVRGTGATAPLLLHWRAHFLALIAEASPASRQLLSQLVHYAAAVTADPPEPLLNAYATIHQAAEDCFMPLADTLIARGFVKGRAEGHAEGHAEGRSEGRTEGLAAGRREALLAVLQARFGEVPATLLAKIEAADAVTLDRLLPIAATAESLDALRD